MSSDLKLYTVKDVMELTGMSESFIRWQYRSGQLGYLRMGGWHTVRFTHAHIAEWIARQPEHPAKGR